MPFDSPPPPDPDNCPWIDVLHQRPPHPEHCYLSESRWRKNRDAAKLDNRKQKRVRRSVKKS